LFVTRQAERGQALGVGGGRKTVARRTTAARAPPSTRSRRTSCRGLRAWAARKWPQPAL